MEAEHVRRRDVRLDECTPPKGVTLQRATKLALSVARGGVNSLLKIAPTADVKQRASRTQAWRLRHGGCGG